MLLIINVGKLLPESTRRISASCQLSLLLMSKHYLDKTHNIYDEIDVGKVFSGYYDRRAYQSPQVKLLIVLIVVTTDVDVETVA